MLMNPFGMHPLSQSGNFVGTVDKFVQPRDAYPESRFLEDLKRWHDQNGGWHVPEPLMGMYTVQLYCLFLEVLRHGGFPRVNKNSKWSKLVKTFGYDAPPRWGRPSELELKTFYVKWVRQFEDDLDVDIRKKLMPALFHEFLRTAETRQKGGSSLMPRSLPASIVYDMFSHPFLHPSFHHLMLPTCPNNGNLLPPHCFLPDPGRPLTEDLQYQETLSTADRTKRKRRKSLKDSNKSKCVKLEFENEPNGYRTKSDSTVATEGYVPEDLDDDCGGLIGTLATDRRTERSWGGSWSPIEKYSQWRAFNEMTRVVDESLDPVIH